MIRIINKLMIQYMISIMNKTTNINNLNSNLIRLRDKTTNNKIINKTIQSIIINRIINLIQIITINNKIFLKISMIINHMSIKTKNKIKSKIKVQISVKN
jgi:hypothetical protein